MIRVDVWFNGFLNTVIEVTEEWDQLVPRCNCDMTLQRMFKKGHHACERGQVIEELLRKELEKKGVFEEVTLISAKYIK